jgi:hypothetical protein
VRHNPEVLNRLGELLAQRQQANVQPAEGTTGLPVVESRESIVRHLRAFFELGD